MASPFPPPHIILPAKPYTHTIIFLHGRNSTGAETSTELLTGLTSTDQSLLELFPSFKWVFPNALITYSEQFQEDLTEWFDLASTSDPHAGPQRQVKGLEEVREYLCGVFEEEMRVVGGGGERIVLGGISQGFATAAYTLLRSKFALGGLIGVSGWIPHRSLIVAAESLAHEQQRNIHSIVGKTSILITHSEDDEVIDIEFGRMAVKELTKLGYGLVRMEEFESGGHALCEPEGFDAVRKFLGSVVEGQDRAA